VRGERYPGYRGEEEEEKEDDHIEVDHHDVSAEGTRHGTTGPAPEEAERSQPALFGQQGTAVDLAPEAQSGSPRRRQEEQVERPPRQAQQIPLGEEPGEQELEADDRD